MSIFLFVFSTKFKIKVSRFLKYINISINSVTNTLLIHFIFRDFEAGFWSWDQYSFNQVLRWTLLNLLSLILIFIGSLTITFFIFRKTSELLKLVLFNWSREAIIQVFYVELRMQFNVCSKHFIFKEWIIINILNFQF